MIYVKRTFHPIGQGAFFTEQFFDNSQDKLLYNVVYMMFLLSKKKDAIRFQEWLHGEFLQDRLLYL